MNSPYNEDYFMRGKQRGLSNYQNYSWLPKLTLPMARRLIDVLGIQVGQSVLDYGCARGYLVKALRQLWIDAYGYDISEWAIEHCDQAVADYVRTALPESTFDFIVAKDVMEHITEPVLTIELARLLERLRRCMLIVVPLRQCGSTCYVRAEDNMDKTHVICWTLDEWLHWLNSVVSKQFMITASWRCPGLKPAAENDPKSVGFFFIRRL